MTEEEVTFLRPSRGWSALNLPHLWRYRELVYFLIWRDVLVRYKQTVLGAAWAVIQPLMNMVVLNFVFGRLANLSTAGIPGPIFTFTGLLPWGLFSKALNDAGRSMLANRNMITKVYFPRLVIPLSSVLGVSFQREDDHAMWNAVCAPFKSAPPAEVCRPVGCLECRNTGYLGRVGLYEILTLTIDLKRLLVSEPDLAKLTEAAYRAGMRPLRVAGAMKVAQGLTTLEEVLKVVPV